VRGSNEEKAAYSKISSWISYGRSLNRVGIVSIGSTFLDRRCKVYHGKEDVSETRIGHAQERD
jgi:hypothetical protein